jgi:hypothetical protein
MTPSLNAHYRCAVRARGHFPTEQAALECLFLVTRSLDRPDAARHVRLREVTAGRVDPFLTATVTRHAQGRLSAQKRC